MVLTTEEERPKGVKTSLTMLWVSYGEVSMSSRTSLREALYESLYVALGGCWVEEGHGTLTLHSWRQ